MLAAADATGQGVSEPDILHTQALVVMAGPFRGRICENDDDTFVFQSELSTAESSWMVREGVVWRQVNLSLDETDVGPDEIDGDPESGDNVGVDCEVVTFGFYLQCNSHHYIPRQFLRPATMKDLISRYEVISEQVTEAALLRRGPARSAQRRADILLEQAYIVDEIWRREALLRDGSEARKVFLCHSSGDKPFVRHVRNDLAAAGHSVWIDEFMAMSFGG